MIVRILAASAFALSAAGAANAQQVDFASLDTDGSGGLSLAEVQAVAPGATAEDFARYDTDGSGELSESEFNAWLNAGTE